MGVPRRSALLGTGLAVASVLVALTLPPIARGEAVVQDLQLSNVAISPDGDGLADEADAGFAIASRAWVRAAVVRPDGSTVRLLWGGVMAPGPTSVGWDGFDDAGARAGDGTYRLRVEAWTVPASAATAPTMQPATAPTAVVERDVRVDTTAPTIRPQRARPTHGATSRLLDLGLQLGEEALVDVRVYEARAARRETLLLALPSGRQRATVRTSDRLFRSRKAGTYRVRLVASDAAWNTTTRWVTVRVKADPAASPPGFWTNDSGVSLPAWLRPVMLRATTGAGVPRSWATSPALAQLLLHESSFNPTAQNPTSTAYGLFQFLDTTWAGSGGHKTSDPYLQSVYGLRYIKNRYRTPERAWAFWQAQSPHWYSIKPGSAAIGRARVTGLELSNTSISPDSDGRADAVEFRTSLREAAAASITVVDGAGLVVRTLWSGDLPAGDTTLSWDGTDDAGAPVADGRYDVQVRTGAVGAPVPASGERTAASVQVDTVAPAKLHAGSKVRVRGSALIRVPVRLSEAASVTVRVQDGKHARELTYLQPAGASTVELRAPRTWQRAKRKGRGSVTLEASDAAWNERTETVPVEIQPLPVAPPTPSWGGGQLLMPVRAPITSGFGARWGRMHEGLDFGAATGTPIHAAAAGRVVVAGWAGGYGNAVYLDHGNGLLTRYGHQSRIAVRVGQVLKRGQVLGYVGSTGHSTGPHLHFEVRINGSARNPLIYL